MPATAWSRGTPRSLAAAAAGCCPAPAVSEDLCPAHNGRDFFLDFMEQVGEFGKPVLVQDSDDLVLPDKPFDVGDVATLIGPQTSMPVARTDAAEAAAMPLHEWRDYMAAPAAERDRVLSISDFNLVGTRLADLVEPPSAVVATDWLSNGTWPEYSGVSRVCIDRFCSMAAAGAFSGFRLGLGGASTWLHVYSGERVFYLVEPTVSNMDTFKQCSNGGLKDVRGFVDLLDVCHRVQAGEGATIFIPAGWIFAEHTVKDTLVFGGYFVSEYNVERQMKACNLAWECPGLDPRSAALQAQIACAHVFGADSMVQGSEPIAKPMHDSAAALIRGIQRWDTAELLPATLKSELDPGQLCLTLESLLPVGLLAAVAEPEQPQPAAAGLKLTLKLGADGSAGSPSKLPGLKLSLNTMGAKAKGKAKARAPSKAKAGGTKKKKPAAPKPRPKVKKPAEPSRPIVNDYIVGEKAIDAILGPEHNDGDFFDEGSDEGRGDAYRIEYGDLEDEAFDLKEEKRFERKFVKKPARVDSDDATWLPPESKKRKLPPADRSAAAGAAKKPAARLKLAKPKPKKPGSARARLFKKTGGAGRRW